MGHYDSTIKANERKINYLHTRIHETFKSRNKNAHKRIEWQKACEEFHAQYDALAFPGGFNGAYERMINGDPVAMEAGICFLECRPYFFRSGYMFKDILRKLKKAPLSKDQQERLKKVQKAYDNYRKTRNARL